MKKNMILASKKGQLGIGILFLAIVTIISLVVFGMINLASFSIFHEINENIASDGEMGVQGTQVLNNLHNSMPKNLDSTVAVILGLLLVVVAFVAWDSMNNNIMLIILIFIILFLIVVGALLSNAWGEYSSDSEYSSVINSFPITNWVLSNFLVVVLAIGGTSLLVIGLRSRLE